VELIVRLGKYFPPVNGFAIPAAYMDWSVVTGMSRRRYISSSQEAAPQKAILSR
jgi:hypothetical protein